MACERQARIDLRNALISYMAGEIGTFAFDDRNSSSSETSDGSVREIARLLYNLHDDFIDHPISVSPQGWEVLRRVVAFLGADLEIGATQKHPSWPFRNEEEWHANEHLVDGIDLPHYNAEVQGCAVNPWRNRIPMSVGFVLLGGLVVAVIVAIALC